ncbi:MAG: hypothetical protein NE330_12100 [Lentisphaeraceae bacterium]|nr:hypothetical protein [Lentisphaeraceae bacterium]
MKNIIKVCVLIVIAVLCIDPYANYKVDKGFEELNPEQCMAGAEIKRRLWKHYQAVSIYKKVQKKFPEYDGLAKTQYFLAYCYEKEGQDKMAMTEYTKYFELYPNDEFHSIAKKRFSNLEANASTN